MTATSRYLRAALVVACLSAAAAPGDEEKINYDEALVGSYVLPDPLAGVDSAAAWRDRRRPEILGLFEKHVYGRPLPKPERLQFAVEISTAFDGKATRKRVRVAADERTGAFPLLTITMYVPQAKTRAVPVFVGMHLFDTTAANPQPGKPLEVAVGEPLPGGRLMEVILERGYAVATLDAKDFCPDDKDQFRSGVLAHYFPNRSGPPGPEEPGAIATWAWRLSRALDYFETDPDVDARRVAVIGHSRMGKTALWAGAEDPRFAIVISNNSGCGGAALSRRIYGETVGRITRVFPHWFCGNFSHYAERERELPVDQHELVALVAPRPVYIASAQEDRWADPRGEFLAAAGAHPVYRLLGREGLGVDELPALGNPVGDSIGYHLRPGPHALTDYDWLRYLDFADRHWDLPAAKGKQIGRGR